MPDSNVELVSHLRLEKHPDNPRVGDIAAIRDSIRNNGWVGTIVAQRSTGYILAGNHRFEAALAEDAAGGTTRLPKDEHGMLMFPVFWVDCDATVARRILVADNRTTDLSHFDETKLAPLLQLIIADQPEDPAVNRLAGTAFTEEQFEQLQIGLTGGQVREWGELGTMDDSLDRYAQSQIRQMVLIFTPAEYEQVLPRLDAILTEQGLDTFKDAWLWLLEQHAPAPQKETVNA